MIRLLSVGLAALTVAIVLPAPAAAYWSSTGQGLGSVTTGSLGAATGVTVPASSASAVPVTWTAAAGAPAPAGYYVLRRSGATSVAACASGPGAVITSTSCTDTAVPDGSYTYVVVAVYRSWLRQSAASGTVLVATPTKLAITTQPGNAVAGADLTPPVAVTVQTASSVPVARAGIAVTLAIGTNPGGGVLSGTVTTTTNAAGVATFPGLSINRAGVGYTLIASSTGLTSATSSQFTITAAAASKVVFTSVAVSGVAASSASLGPLSVQVQDAFNNPVPAPVGGTVLSLATSSSGVTSPVRLPVFSLSVSGAGVSSVTVPAGSSSVSFFYGDPRAGSPTITVGGGSLTAATQVQTITPAAAAQLAFVQQPTNTVKAATISPPITVRVIDQFGNQVNSTASISMSIENNAGGLLTPGILLGTTTKAAVAGVATFDTLSINALLGIGGEGNGYTLRASAVGLTAAISSPFNIT